MKRRGNHRDHEAEFAFEFAQRVTSTIICVLEAKGLVERREVADVLMREAVEAGDSFRSEKARQRIEFLANALLAGKPPSLDVIRGGKADD